MTNVFIVIDKTDASYHKAFTAICYQESKAQEIVAKRQNQLPDYEKNLVRYEPVKVDDCKVGEKHILVVFNKTDNPRMRSYHSMHFNSDNAQKIVANLRAGVSEPAKKLIFSEMKEIIQ